MPIFSVGTQGQRSTINKYMESRIKAPYVFSQVSTLGGIHRASVMIKVSLDPRSKWANGIFQNSRYAMFSLDRDGTLELFSLHYQLKKMRKSKAKSIPDAVARINKWIASAK